MEGHGSLNRMEATATMGSEEQLDGHGTTVGRDPLVEGRPVG